MKEQPCIPPLDALSWWVMDATADDWESHVQILSHLRGFRSPAPPAVVAEIIARLVCDGLIEEMKHLAVDPAAILSDPVEFWFRMTPLGRKAWESASSEFTGEDA